MRVEVRPTSEARIAGASVAVHLAIRELLRDGDERSAARLTDAVKTIEDVGRTVVARGLSLHARRPPQK